MAALIGKVRGYSNGREVSRNSSGNGEARRLAADQMDAEANTRTTFAKATMFADGSGVFVLRRGKHEFKVQWKDEQSIELDGEITETMPNGEVR